MTARVIYELIAFCSIPFAVVGFIVLLSRYGTRPGRDEVAAEVEIEEFSYVERGLTLVPCAIGCLSKCAQ